MSPAHLAEHAEAARIALDLAERQAAHLRYITVTNLGKAYKQYPAHWSRLAEWVLAATHHATTCHAC